MCKIVYIIYYIIYIYDIPKLFFGVDPDASAWHPGEGGLDIVVEHPGLGSSNDDLVVVLEDVVVHDGVIGLQSVKLGPIKQESCLDDEGDEHGEWRGDLDGGGLSVSRCLSQ